MIFRLSIDTSNDAFSDDVCAELARILRQTATRVGNGQEDGNLSDGNGNKVGSFSLIEGEE